MRERFNKFLTYFDIPGGVVLGLFSLEMLAMIAYYACNGRELPATIRDVYGIVVGAFAASSIARHYGKRSKDNEPKS